MSDRAKFLLNETINNDNDRRIEIIKDLEHLSYNYLIKFLKASHDVYEMWQELGEDGNRLSGYVISRYIGEMVLS